MDNINEYLKYYLGCQVQHGAETWQLAQIEFDGKFPKEVYVATLRRLSKISGYWDYREIEILRFKPILRRLEDMTEEELREVLLLANCDLSYKTRPLQSENRKTFDGKPFTQWFYILKKDYGNERVIVANLSSGHRGLNLQTGTCYADEHWAIMHYLLSRGFWLFGDEAFDKGLIIDAKTLQI